MDHTEADIQAIISRVIMLDDDIHSAFSLKQAVYTAMITNNVDAKHSKFVNKEINAATTGGNYNG